MGVGRVLSAPAVSLRRLGALKRTPCFQCLRKSGPVWAGKRREAHSSPAIAVPSYPRKIGGSQHRPRASAAPRRRQPWEPHGTITAHKRQHQWGRSQSRSPQAETTQPRFPRKQRGYIGGNPPMRALWLLSLAREKVTPPAGAHPGRTREKPRRGVPCHPPGNRGEPYLSHLEMRARI